jgi:hypothetical protein
LVLPDPNNVKDLVERLRRWRAELSIWRDRFASFGPSLRRRGWTDMAARLIALAEAAPAIGPYCPRAGGVGAPAALPLSFRTEL